MVGIAPNKPELPRVIRQLETERSGQEIERCIIIPAIQIDVRQLDRPISMRATIRVIQSIANDCKIPPFDILETESVPGTWSAQLPRRTIR